jgi:hypothetical protein
VLIPTDNFDHTLPYAIHLPSSPSSMTPESSPTIRVLHDGKMRRRGRMEASRFFPQRIHVEQTWFLLLRCLRFPSSTVIDRISSVGFHLKTRVVRAHHSPAPHLGPLRRAKRTARLQKLHYTISMGWRMSSESSATIIGWGWVLGPSL